MLSFWQRAPLVRVALPALLGCALACVYPIQAVFLQAIIALVAACGIGVAFAYRRAWSTQRFQRAVSTLLYASTLLVFYSWGSYYASSRVPVHPFAQEPQWYYGQLIHAPDSSGSGFRMEVQILGIRRHSGQWSRRDARVQAFAASLSDSGNWLPGSPLLFYGKPEVWAAPVNPGQFDYGSYLRQQGVAGRVYIPKNMLLPLDGSPQWSLSLVFYKFRLHAGAVLRQAELNPGAYAIAQALFLGDRSFLDRYLEGAFADAGVIHVLAVSGLHVGIVFLILHWMLAKLLPGKRLQWPRFAAIILLLWMYAGITGFSPSVLRAATMFSFVALGKQFKRGGTIYNMLAASALLLMLIRPSIVSEVAFQLSYVAVLGIVVMYKPVYAMLQFSYWLPDKLWSLLVVSFAAQLATFPLSLYYFGQFPNYFLLTNLVVVPLIGLLLYTGFAFFLLCWVPLLSKLLAHFLALQLSLLNEFVTWMAALPFAVSEHLAFGIAAVILCYGAIILFLAFIYSPLHTPLWLSLSCLALLLLRTNWRVLQTASTSELIFMEGYQSGVLLARFGHAAAIIARGDSADSERFDYYLDGYFRSMGMPVPEVNYIGDTAVLAEARVLLRGDLIVVDGLCIQALYSSNQPILAAHWLWVLPGSESSTRASECEDLRVFLDPALSWYEQRDWLQVCEKGVVQCYSLERSQRPISLRTASSSPRQQLKLPDH